MKLDILGIFAHPDDAEISSAGTLLSHKKMGKKIGIVDLTQGEMGTRGTAEIRRKEAEKSAQILGLDIRENLELEDVFFTKNHENKKKVIQVIRKYSPDIIITNALHDRHPDHKRAAELVTESCFLSGLKKYGSFIHNEKQKEWRPKKIFYTIQFEFITPDFIVDISDNWEEKKQALLCYETQFYSAENEKKYEKDTFISTKSFFDFIEARARVLGQSIGVKYGEGFVKHSPIGIKNLFDLHIPDLV